MIRNIFSRRRPSEEGTGDDFDRFISKIERFAPKRYRAERDSYYYNYRMLNPYVGPLLALLTEIANQSCLSADAILLKRLFEKLKEFYDPKGRLSVTQSLEDSGLRRKFLEMLSYFYREKEFSEGDIKRFFGDMKIGDGRRNESVE